MWFFFLYFLVGISQASWVCGFIILIKFGNVSDLIFSTFFISWDSNYRYIRPMIIQAMEVHSIFFLFIFNSFYGDVFEFTDIIFLFFWYYFSLTSYLNVNPSSIFITIGSMFFISKSSLCSFLIFFISSLITLSFSSFWAYDMYLW